MPKCRMCSLEILAQAVQQRGVDLRVDPTLLEECVIDAKDPLLAARQYEKKESPVLDSITRSGHKLG